MPLSKEQTTQLKKQLIKQLQESTQENKEQIIQYIAQLEGTEFEDFLTKQNIHPNQEQTRSEKQIFQAIVDNEIPSYKLNENAKAIVILEINPLSKGHALVIPKQPSSIERISKSAMTLAQSIAKKIKSKLKPEDIKIETFSLQNYPAINIIPLYKDQQLTKYKADEKELKSMQKKLETKRRAKRSPPSKKIRENMSKNGLPELGFRIP